MEEERTGSGKIGSQVYQSEDPPSTLLWVVFSSCIPSTFGDRRKEPERRSEKDESLKHLFRYPCVSSSINELCACMCVFYVERARDDDDHDHCKERKRRRNEKTYITFTPNVVDLRRETAQSGSSSLSLKGEGEGMLFLLKKRREDFLPSSRNPLASLSFYLLP